MQKKKLSKKQIDLVLQAYAKENRDKYGSEEEIIEELKKHYKKKLRKKYLTKDE